MNAYTLVDSQTRKKLDEMLKTWKEPVPGSLDPRPVFPVEITRSIENALIKARTAALQQQQQQQARSQQDVLGRSRGVATPPGWTHTPTPPRYPPPSGSNYPPQFAANGHAQAYSSAVSTGLPIGFLRNCTENVLGRIIPPQIFTYAAAFSSSHASARSGD
jgi:pre-mRNA cleavage complex 2 protein Pcf11